MNFFLVVLNPQQLAGEVLDHLAVKKIWRTLVPMRLTVEDLASRCLNYLDLTDEDEQPGDLAIRCDNLCQKLERDMKKHMPLFPRAQGYSQSQSQSKKVCDFVRLHSTFFGFQFQEGKRKEKYRKIQ